MGRATVAAIVALWTVSISVVVNRIVPKPYMDEIFHIPQAQKYCSGNFSDWDPMITTPPGLYYLSIVPIAALFVKPSLSLSAICSTSFLRATNGVFSIICSVLIYDLIVLLRPKIDKRRATACAICVALYPVHWFFTFLYYTDVTSTAAVLAMFLACLKGHYWISSLIGAFSIFIRQTNVIWLLFVASNAAIGLMNASAPKGHDISGYSSPPLMKNEAASNKTKVLTKSELRRRFQRSIQPDESPIGENLSSSTGQNKGFSLADLWHELYATIIMVWHFRWSLLVSFFPFILVLVGFVAFVLWNGSVVLGAKEHHVASPHFAQMVYFGIICAAITAPLHFNFKQVGILMKLLWVNKTRGIFMLTIALAAAFVSLHRFSIYHPYLLADNRHYPFYFRKKILQGHWTFKHLMIPLSVYSWFSIANILGKSTGRIWALLFFKACVGTLVPSPVVEFRYFTIPIILFLINSKIDGQKSLLVLTFALFIAMDLFTMWMFLLRPFEWAHEPGIQQRFMW
ncbi:DIE2/ALG10 family isoform X2 [Wolffia australiana]